MTLEHQTNDKKPQHWRAEFGGVRRTPRPWNPEVADLLDSSWPVTLFLRENKKTTDIVLRLPLSSQQLSEKVKEAYFRQGISIKNAFQEIVWNAPRIGDTSFWARIAKAGHDAYWAAWMHLLDVVYGEHSWPEVNSQMTKWLGELKAIRKSSSSGRRKEVDAERENLSKRFQQLLQWCRSIHKLVQQCNDDKLPMDQIRAKIFKQIYGQRNDHFILSGKAFAWSLNRKEPVLHDARSWTPPQLATALLALERGGLEYATVARKISARPNKKQSR